jgi:tetratricopeptide (TPR) repeat protein
VGAGNWKLVAPGQGFGTSTDSRGVITVPDRAHNVYVQCAAEKGIAGLLTYLALGAVTVLVGIFVILRTDQNDRRFLGILSLAVVCTYAVDSLASFPDESFAHWLLLAFAVGTLAAQYQKLALPAPKPPRALVCSKAWLLAPALFLAFCVYLGQAKETFEFHRKRARAYYEKGNYRQVLVETEAGRTPLVNIDPVALPLELWSSRAYKGLGELDMALGAAQRALAICPWSVTVWNDVGTIYVAQNRPDDAITCFQKALGMAPEFDAALKNLAFTYARQGKFQESYEMLLKSRWQTDVSLVNLMYSVCLKLEKYDEAAEAMRAGLVTMPDSPDLLENLAYLEYTHLKDMTNAYTHFQRLLELQPNHPKQDEYTKVINYLSRRIKRPAGQPPKTEGLEAPAPVTTNTPAGP